MPLRKKQRAKIKVFLIGCKHLEILIFFRVTIAVIEIFSTFAVSFLKICIAVSKSGRHIIKTLSYVLSAVYRTSQLLFLLRGKAMVNVYVFVYYANRFMFA